jgi:large subunit ribosomal protein L5
MRLQETYKKEILPKLKQEFGCTNDLAVPRLQRVTVNVGVGRVSKDKAKVESVEETLRVITGQKPVVTKARKSIASFKVRAGMPAGVVVTLRGRRMYDFVEKLVHVTLPRVRDFRGLSPKSFDKQGNYTIGFKENLAFPELRADDLESIHGLEVCIATTARSREEGTRLLQLLGFPFKKE